MITLSSTRLVLVVLAVGTGALYLVGLHDAAPAPLRDEMYFAVTAHSVASTGRDLSGHFLPVYFPVGPVDQPLMWFQPLLMYAIAAVLEVVPLSEEAIRLPMALVAVANVLLTYLVARLIVRRELPAVAAAVMLALAPAHFLFGRTATDYLLPVPFILGWLWCVLRYLENGQPRVLLAGGLSLGIGLYSLIASYFLMPFYAVLTCAVLWWRGAPANRYLIVAAGLFVPAVVGLAFIAAHPEMIRTVMARYDPSQAQAAGAFAASRLQNLSVFWSFWDLELLAINGGHMLTGAAGVFVLPTVAAAAVGIVRCVIEPNLVSLLLLGGLIVTPLPASLVDEPGAIRRVLAMLPFVVLLAGYGLDWIGAATAMRRRLAFVSAFLFVAYLCVAYRPQLPLAQAYIRAATLPLMLVAMAVLFGRGLSAPGSRRWQWHLGAAFVAFGFVYVYVDFLFVHRVGAVPATAIIWLYRAVCASLIALLATVLTRPATLPRSRRALGIAAGMFVLAVAYFNIDRFTEFGPRYLHVALVATGTIVVATWLRRAALTRQQLGRLATVAMLAMTLIQFAVFHRDYRSDYRMRRASVEEGSVMRAFDAVLERPDIDSVPAIYLADPMERADVRDVFWRFAVLKHGRPQLLERTFSELDTDVNAERAASLPPRSLLVTGTSAATANAIEQLVARGVLRKEGEVLASDGRPIAWILQRSTVGALP